jgi:CDP-glycerol glycerophosphotransferase
MPKLSFVCVVHREQGHLVRLAASILDQANADVELIAIDDASPDHAPALLDELAQRDPRVRVRHLESRVGLAEGRNLGLALAAGEYVWFVRSTGYLLPGSIAAVTERLEAARPDVLLAHHADASPLGIRRPGPHGPLLERLADRGTLTLAEFPELAEVVPEVDGKVFRRDFLRELAVSFAGGGHGEVEVTWPALLSAHRVAAAASESYVRRTPPNEVSDSFVAGSPFDVFPAYDRVLRFIDERAGELKAQRPLVLSARRRHERSLMWRAPALERAEFARRMSGGRLEYLGLLLRDRARVTWRRMRRAAWRLRRRVRRVLRGNAALFYYRARLRAPIDQNLAVFAAYWYRGYQCNPRAIYERLRELVPEVRGVWVVQEESAAAIPEGVDYVIAGTREYYDLIARARWFVNNVNFPNHLVKREGTTHVMTHHGTPVKQMGLDLLDTPGAGYRTGLGGLLRRSARWDYSVTQNAFTTIAWDRAFPLRYETLEVGYPRNDVLANASDEDVRRIRELLGIAPGQRAVLYAPTHREYHPEYTSMLDLSALADGLGPDYVVMARLHYLYDTDPHLRALHEAGRVRDVADHPAVEELCLAADVLITDYSSIMFDYAVLDRPIVIHAPDWDEYRLKRGVYLDLTTEGPGIVTVTEPELIEAFRSGGAWGEQARLARSSFRARFCSLDDGGAAERVVRRVWLGARAPSAQPVAAAAR